MKPVVKQKLSTLQDIINNAQSGGGGTVDAYTKAEADAKFETITGAASTYLPKADAVNMPHKIISTLSQSAGPGNILQATIDDVALLDFEGALFTFCIYAQGLEGNYYFTSSFSSFNDPISRTLMFFKDDGTPEERITIKISLGTVKINYDITDANYTFISGRLAVIF